MKQDNLLNIALSSIDEQLLQATNHGNITAVSNLLRLEANVNTENNNGCTPLSIAIKNNDTDMVKLLLQHAANIYTQDIDNNYTIFMSINSKNLSIAELVITAGGKKLSSSLIGDALLLEVIENIEINDVATYYMKALEMLLILGFNPNSTSFTQDEIALCELAKIGNLTAINLLIKHQANIEIKDINGRSALFYAATFGHLNVVTRLCDLGANVNGCNIQNTDIKQLIKSVWQLEDNNYRTPLMLSIKIDRSLKLPEKLIQLGAPIDQYNSQGKTPFLYACSSGSTNIIEKFLLYGDHLFPNQNSKSCLVNQCDTSGKNSLFIAVEKKNVNLVKILLQFTADLDAPDNNGYTPYLLALKMKADSPVIAKLLQDQRDINDIIKNNNKPPRPSF